MGRVDPCAEFFKAIAQTEEFQKHNPYLARLLMKYPTYFLEWDEKGLGLFMWRVWESWAGDESMMRLVEESIEAWSRMRFPWRMRRCRKLVYAARMALKLIRWEKEVLGITY